MKAPVETAPEPLEALQARYPACLEFVYDQRAIVETGAVRPGEVAAQVFDFDDGLRLIVGRERDFAGAVWLHFSASFAAHCRIVDEFRLLKLTMPLAAIFERWRRGVPGRFAELSGDAREPTYLGRSYGGIPHWVIREPS